VSILDDQGARLTLSKAARYATQLTGIRTSAGSINRWMKCGTRGGVRLECGWLGARRYTTEDAVRRFVRATTDIRCKPVQKPHERTEPPRTEPMRRRASEAAARQCEELGL
jgi:hypothetical protein